MKVVTRFKQLCLFILVFCIMFCSNNFSIFANSIPNNLLAKKLHVIAYPEKIGLEDSFVNFSINFEDENGNMITYKGFGNLYEPDSLEISPVFFGCYTSDGFGAWNGCPNCSLCKPVNPVQPQLIQKLMYAIKSLDCGNTYNLDLERDGNRYKFNLTIPYFDLSVNSDVKEAIDSAIIEYASFIKNNQLVTYDTVNDIEGFPYNHIGKYSETKKLVCSDNNELITLSYLNRGISGGFDWCYHDVMSIIIDENIIAEKLLTEYIDTSKLYFCDGENNMIDMPYGIKVENLSFGFESNAKNFKDDIVKKDFVFENFTDDRLSNHFVSFDLEIDANKYYIPTSRRTLSLMDMNSSSYDIETVNDAFSTNIVKYKSYNDGSIKLGLDLVDLSSEYNTSNINIDYSTYRTNANFSDSDYLSKGCILNEDTTYIIDNIMLDDGTKYSLTKDSFLANIYVDGVLKEDKMYGYYGSSYFNYYFPKIVGEQKYKVQAIKKNYNFYEESHLKDF